MNLVPSFSVSFETMLMLTYYDANVNNYFLYYILLPLLIIIDYYYN